MLNLAGREPGAWAWPLSTKGITGGRKPHDDYVRDRRGPAPEDLSPRSWVRWGNGAEAALWPSPGDQGEQRTDVRLSLQVPHPRDHLLDAVGWHG